MTNHNKAAVHGWSVSQSRHHAVQLSVVLVGSFLLLSSAASADRVARAVRKSMMEFDQLLVG